mmetsp:Transcript_6999/g.15965  ORF Transcript_6999/g.15965 Transcript_6999/m.15965 type:complete len:80 (+) Transcript_6999:1125-1364(+)
MSTKDGRHMEISSRRCHSSRHSNRSTNPDWCQDWSQAGTAKEKVVLKVKVQKQNPICSSNSSTNLSQMLQMALPNLLRG